MSKTIYSDQIKVNCLLVHDENGYYHLVYKVTNAVNGKIYIGKHSTKNPYDKYMGSGKRLWCAIKKYGIDNFTKEILYCFNNEKEAYLKEEELVTQEFIDRNDTYNMVIGGHGFSSLAVKGENNYMYGKHLNQETKDKISKANSGKNSWWYGKHHTQESKDKMSKASKGRIFTEEHKENISKSHIGKPGPWLGKHRSAETKEKLSKANKGKPGPWLGKQRNPETVEKWSKAVLKIDEFGNIVTEYKCMKDCRKQEHIGHWTLTNLIEKGIPRNGFYFKLKK